MQVELVNWTTYGKEMLILAKSTRLKFDAKKFEEILNWSDEDKDLEIDYISKTIPSSWEFVDYTFVINEVTRAFTHQFIRNRTGSYAQQSMRTIDEEGFNYEITGDLKDPKDEKQEENRNIYMNEMDNIADSYKLLKDRGVPPQDARGILPTNICNGILGKFNLRNISGMAELRLCSRSQGEMQNVMRLMREKIIEVHPWAEKFINCYCVNHGTCAFPNYKGCSIKPSMFEPSTGGVWDENGEPRQLMSGERPLSRQEVYERWCNTMEEAVPIHDTRS